MTLTLADDGTSSDRGAHTGRAVPAGPEAAG
jgi:hypothetical protein